MLVLITYDVNTADPAGRTRLRRIAKQCVNYGQRVQNSVFECLLDASQCRSLQNTLCKLIDTENEAYEKFKKALYIVMECMTMMLASDGEGATKMIECTVAGAPDLDTAIIVAKSVIRSPLTKCAMFGEDANWGRILCAIGYAEADFDIDKVAVDLESEFGVVPVCRNGAGVPFSEEKAAKVLSSDEIHINIDLGIGDVTAKAWGCDLTYDYVKINGDYRS